MDTNVKLKTGHLLAKLYGKKKTYNLCSCLRITGQVSQPYTNA